jgi:putative ABC transport system permease protein
MTNIGILKATGNTSNQIIAAIVLQYGSITAFAGLLGILASFISTPVLSSAFAGLIGLDWKQGFDPFISAVSFIAVTGTASVVSVLSAGRINKLHPVSALRGDSTAKGVKRNFFPLDKTPVDLPAALALKDIFQKIKQNLMISLIITGVTFTGMFSIVMYYNFAVDNSSFINLGMGEPCNVSAYAETSNDELLRRIERMPEVRKAVISQTEYSRAVTTINNEKIYPTVMDDFSVSDNTMLISGKYPQSANEICFPGVLAKRYGKQIGDIVSLKIGNREEDYIICGITQSLNNSGRMAAMTLSGIKLLLPDFELLEISISLNKYENTREFMGILKDEYGDYFIDIINVDELIDGQMGTFVSMTVLLSSVVIVTSLLVVILVLYLIVKINISQKRREFGIQKAIGYTTAQLMTRISMGFMPVVLFGSAIGGILSLAYINSVLSVLFGAIGVMEMNFVIRVSWAVITALLITGFSYAVSMFISWRIRKISPYVLASE